MGYDLRLEAWIPWLRRDGSVEWGPPAVLVDALHDNPVVAIAAPRPDFEGALQEFLIGLLTVALRPEDEDAWYERWASPPTCTELASALGELPPAFDLDGAGPRFFQDLSAAELSEGAEWSIESLLIDAPGSTVAEARRRDVATDLFVKPGRVLRLGRPAAAMALLTLQTYAPEGGRGHLTSMRGGGPLTTLVDPRAGLRGADDPRQRPLWWKLWANVETVEQWSRRAPPGESDLEWSPESVFPWLGPTRSAAPPSRRVTTAADASPLQAYFAMPRRIRLDIAGPGRCDLTGRDEPATVVSFRMRTYGVQYEGWRHPLSPYYRSKTAGELLPQHGRAGGIAWRDWLGLTVRAPDAAADRQPAAVVADFNDRARRIGAPVMRVHAFGYAMSHAKAIAWTDAQLPAFTAASREQLQLLADVASRFTLATQTAASALHEAVKHALFGGGEGAPPDVRSELWAITEATFYAAMRRLSAPEADSELAADLCSLYAPQLAAFATAVFDRWCNPDALSMQAMRRLVGARLDLVRTFTGTSPSGRRLFKDLGIAVPDAGPARGKSTHPREEVSS